MNYKHNSKENDYNEQNYLIKELLDSLDSALKVIGQISKSK